MSEAALDPYAVLGVAPDVSDIELRRVYRSLVQRHHPDHNDGSAESAARFALIQSAYAQIARHRRPPQPEGPETGTAGGTGEPAVPHERSDAAADAGIEDRIASLEREMAEQRAVAQRRAEQRRAEEQARLARERSRQATENLDPADSDRIERQRPTPQELGYYTTDDSFTKIIDDAADQLSERMRNGDAKRQFARRLSDLFGHEE